MNVKSLFDLRRRHNRKNLCFVSLWFMIVLVSSCFVSVLSGVSPFASGTPDKIVSNETELRNVINNTVNPVVIALGNDITLTGSLIIPFNKNITLISDNASKFFKLNGVNGQSTIIVEKSGVLRLEEV
jgi:hypothetical protein